MRPFYLQAVCLRHEHTSHISVKNVNQCYPLITGPPVLSLQTVDLHCKVTLNGVVTGETAACTRLVEKWNVFLHNRLQYHSVILSIKAIMLLRRPPAMYSCCKAPSCSVPIYNVVVRQVNQLPGSGWFTYKWYLSEVNPKLKCLPITFQLPKYRGDFLK